MKEDYTNDDMVRLLYRELPADEAVVMMDVLEDDADMLALFNDLLVAKVQLPKARFNPSPTVLHNILQYSTKTALEATL